MWCCPFFPLKPTYTVINRVIKILHLRHVLLQNNALCNIVVCWCILFTSIFQKLNLGKKWCHISSVQLQWAFKGCFFYFWAFYHINKSLDITLLGKGSCPQSPSFSSVQWSYREKSITEVQEMPILPPSVATTGQNTLQPPLPSVALFVVYPTGHSAVALFSFQTLLVLGVEKLLLYTIAISISLSAVHAVYSKDSLVQWGLSKSTAGNILRERYL